MANRIFAELTTSISEFKKNPMAVIEMGEGFPVAGLNHNQPVFYCVPADAYELLLDKLEDIELANMASDRTGEEEIEVSESGL